MANTSFTILSWSEDELIQTSKLNAMVSNDEWLRYNMVQGNYTGFTKNKKDGVRLMGGIALINSAATQSAAKQVNFNGFFNSNSKPIVTTGIISSHQRRIFCTIDGIGKPFPDGRGFTAHVFMEADNDANRKIKYDFYISWLAMAW